jgi:hypothetical protein
MRGHIMGSAAACGFPVCRRVDPGPQSAITLGSTSSVASSVHAFVVGEVIVDIGLTNNTLRTRFDQYHRGHKG